MAEETSKPKLDPAQIRFYEDESRVQVVCWHRQKGKDFTTAAKAVMQSIITGQAWYIVSLTQRQADATFEKCKYWANIYKSAVQEYRYEVNGEYDPALDDQFKFYARELTLPGGGKVVSLPGRDPDTLAGLTGNVIFTEFGLFPNGGYDHWRVVFPLATRGYHVIVISTPRSRNTKFFELVNDPETYSVHFCDIYQSVKEGFKLTDQNGQPCSLDEFKKLYGDAAGWEREYECKFTGDLEAIVKWAQLAEAERLGKDLPFDLLRVEGESGWQPGWFNRFKVDDGRFEIGWDVARSGHLSSLWINHARPGHPKHLRFLVLMHGVSFELQREIVTAAMGIGSRCVGCGDSTGLGMDSNETLQTRFGERWEPVNFGGTRKTELVSTLATTFGDGGQTLPSFDSFKFVAADIYAIEKEDIGAGNSRRLKIQERDNPLMPESHCDIAYSGALALRAGLLSDARVSATWI